MQTNIRHSLSIVLILGIILKKFPLFTIQPFLKKAIKIMVRKHRRVFEKISQENYNFLINPIDLPFSFYLKASLDDPILLAIKKSENPKVSATITGTLENLFLLFEGKIDGDAAFFSKELIIEGSTAATVALRNAIDSEDMNIIKDLSEIFSPFENIFEKFIIYLAKKYNEAQNSLDIISKSILNNVEQELASKDSQIDSIYEEIDKIKKSLKSLIKEKERKDLRKKSDYQEIV